MAVVSAQPIAAGYAYGLRLTFAGGAPLFPAGCALRAEVRDYPGAPALAGVLTTDSGTVSVVDGETLEMFLSPALTGALGRRTCAIDLVRTDTALPTWLGVQLQLPVATSVTRSGADGLGPGRISSDVSASMLATVIAPLGIIIALGIAVGLAPWSKPQILAPAVAVGRGEVPTPSLTVGRVITVLPSALGPTGVVPAPAVVSVPAIAPATVGSGATLPAPGISLQPPQLIGVLPPAPSATVGAPSIAPEAAKVIGGAGAAVTTMVGSPLLTTDGTVVLGPAAIAAASVVSNPSLMVQPPQVIGAAPMPSGTIPAPTVTQQSTNSYAADGYVADGYYGAS